MKIIKYIFLLLFLAAVAGVVFIATQNGKYDVTEQRVIKVPKNILYNYINDYRNWENAGILTGSDTTAVFTFSGNTFGEGASASWKMPNSEGNIKTIKLVENDSIFQKALINNEDSDVTWAFKDTLNSTKVTITMTGNLTFTEKAYALINGNTEDKLGATLKKGLANINTFLVDELNTFDIKVQEEIISKTGNFYIGQTVTCKIADVNKKMTDILPKLISYVKTNKMVTHGSPFTLFKTFDTINNTATFKVCVPLKEEIFTTKGSEFEGGKMEAFNALKTTLTGDYSHLKKAWDAGFKHIADKQIELNTTGTFLEVYNKNTQQTKRPSQWITNIYIPVGPPAPITDSTAVDVAILPIGNAAPPAGTAAKPAATGVKPPATATSAKPASTATNRPTATGINKPASATVKPTGTTPATTKPATTKPTAAKPTNTTVKPAAPKNTKPKDTLRYKK